MSKALIDTLEQAVAHLWYAVRESQPTPDHPAGRPVVAYAYRREALRILGGVHKQLSGELDAASEAVESHLLSQGVRKLSLTDPAVTLYIERRPFISIVKQEVEAYAAPTDPDPYEEGDQGFPGGTFKRVETVDEAHTRVAEALSAAGMDEFVNTRINLQGLTSHYRELLESEGDEAVNARLAEELGGSVAMTVTSKVKTRKAG